MVTYRSVTVLLRSHFDPLRAIPEFTSPHLEKRNPESGEDRNSQPCGTSHQPPITDTFDVSVYIPYQNSGQFSIDYAVAPPQPASMFFYFKLFVNGKHAVSWGVGEADNFCGRTSFALFDASNKNKSSRYLERRSFFSSSPRNVKPDGSGQAHSDGTTLEILVYRSSSRRRVTPIIDKFRKTALGQAQSNEVDLVHVGTTKNHSQRFYEFSLIDHPDRPFAKFNYISKNWDELVAPGSALAQSMGGMRPDAMTVPPQSTNASHVTSRIERATVDKPFSKCYHTSRFVEHCSPWGECDPGSEGKSVSAKLKRLSFPRLRTSLRPQGHKGTEPMNLAITKRLSAIPENESPERASSPQLEFNRNVDWPLRPESSSASSRALLGSSRRHSRSHLLESKVKEGIMKAFKGKRTDHKTM